MRRASAVLKLLRPINLMMFVMGVFVGGVVAAGGAAFGPEALRQLVLAAVAVAAIGGAGNALNDVVDVRIDRVNRPSRPIPSGRISRKGGVAVWIAASAAGLVMSALVSIPHAVISAAAILLLIAYSIRLKRALLAGNVVVSALVATSILFGALAVGFSVEAAHAAIFAFLLTFAREILKDAADEEGDRLVAARTLPIVHGRTVATRVVIAIVALTILLTPVPYLFFGYSSLYLSIVLVADVLLLRAIGRSMDGSREAFDASSELLKWAMIVGMIALALANSTD